MDTAADQEENFSLSLDPVVDEALQSVLIIPFDVRNADLPIDRSVGRSRL